MVVREVATRAWLGDSGPEIAQARRRAACGDPDWQLWVDELDRGEATLIDMRVSVTFELNDGSVETVASEQHHVWMHTALHPPSAAAIIAEMSGNDFDLFARHIHELGETLTVPQLDEMHVTVALDDGFLAVLRPAARTAH